MAETKGYSHHIDLKGNNLLNPGNIYNKTEVDARTVDLAGVDHLPRNGKHNNDLGLSERIASPTWTTLTQYLDAIVAETRKNLHGMLLFMRKVRFMEHEYGRFLRTSTYSQAATVSTFYPLRITNGATGEARNQSIVLGGSGEWYYKPQMLGARLYNNAANWRSIVLNVCAEARITVTNSGSNVATTIKLVARLTNGGTEYATFELDKISFSAQTTGQSFRLFGSDLVRILQSSSEENQLEIGIVVSSGANNTVVMDSNKIYFHKGGWNRGDMTS